MYMEPLPYSVLRESMTIPPPVSGLSVASDAGAPPSAPAGIVNAGGFFLDMTSFFFFEKVNTIVDQPVFPQGMYMYNHSHSIS